jgi:S1-C subfamily serine protease
MSFAVMALAVAVVTVVVVTRRGPHLVAMQDIETVPVAAADVVKLPSTSTQVVDARGTPGVRVTDAALARALALAPDDVITAISGRAIVREHDLRVIVFHASLLGATTLYVEVERAGVPELVRWQVDGNLYEARTATEAIFLGRSPP